MIFSRPMIKVAIVTDHTTCLDTLANMVDVQPDMNCLLRKASIGAFYQALDLNQTLDILLLDQQIGADNSVDHLEKIYKMMPDIPIIIMAENESLQEIRKGLLLGVRGYCVKGMVPAELLTAIREVVAGNAYLSPTASKIALEIIQRGKMGHAPEYRVEKITTRLSWTPTQRELEVIRALIDGQSYKEIAASNHMTIDGVRYYVRSIYPRLGVSSRDQLVRVLTR